MNKKEFLQTLEFSLIENDFDLVKKLLLNNKYKDKTISFKILILLLKHDVDIYPLLDYLILEDSFLKRARDKVWMIDKTNLFLIKRKIIERNLSEQSSSSNLFEYGLIHLNFKLISKDNYLRCIFLDGLYHVYKSTKHDSLKKELEINLDILNKIAYRKKN